MTTRLSALSAEYRTGFDPPFHVSLEAAAVVLTLDAKEPEVEISFPIPVERALADLKAKWIANPDLLCLVAVRSLDPECGDACAERTAALAERFSASIAPAEAPERIRSVGLGMADEYPPIAGVSRAGALRIEIRLFPNVEVPAEATPGHTEAVTTGSQRTARTFWFDPDSPVIPSN